MTRPTDLWPGRLGLELLLDCDQEENGFGSQVRLSDATGIDAGTISKIKNGKWPTYKQAVEIAGHYEVSLDELSGLLPTKEIPTRAEMDLAAMAKRAIELAAMAGEALARSAPEASSLPKPRGREQ